MLAGYPGETVWNQNKPGVATLQTELSQSKRCIDLLMIFVFVFFVFMTLRLFAQFNMVNKDFGRFE